MSLGLVLLHAPSVYDFRKRSLLFGPVSDLIPSTPVFEMYPIGFTSIASLLSKHGYRVRILNIAAHMLADESYDVEKAIGKLRSKVFGVDLHWLPHAHGSLEIAKLIKKIHPDSKVIVGGFSSTYYWEEIMKDHQYVDSVFIGDSTELPMLRYFEALDKNKSLDKVPNLVWRDQGKIRNNGLTHVIDDLDEVEIDYSWVVKSVMRSMDLTGHLPYLDWKRNPMLIVTTVRGCSINCATCMGNCSSFGRNFERRRPAYRSPEKIIEDLQQIDNYFKGTVFLVGDIQQPGMDYANNLLSLLKKEKLKNELAIEFFTPPSEKLAQEIGKSIDLFNAQISPDSHDPVVRKALGRHYSNEALEKGTSDILKAGAKRMDVFFMIGLSQQDRESVLDTVKYSEKLMSGASSEENLMSFISPLAPFLDPGTEVFEVPEKYGYKILARSLAEHRALLTNPSWKYVLNYETEWLTRDEIVDVTYDAGLLMNDAKERIGMISQTDAEAVRSRIILAKDAIKRIDEIMQLDSPEISLAALKDELKTLCESTVCDKRELDWSMKSFYWSIPNIVISTLFRR